jgi:addiction module HigA family antidote
MTVSLTAPVHPGEILLEEFLKPLDMSAGQLAKAIDVPRTRIERIVAETHGITADTALRLARYFGTTPKVWLNLQASYDLDMAVAAPTLKTALDAIEPRTPVDA